MFIVEITQDSCPETRIVVGCGLLQLNGSTTYVSAAEWAYEDGSTGPEDWPGVCVAGAQQSPIDLKPDIGHSGHFESLVLINYDRKMAMNITNDGHTAKVLVEQPCAVAMAAGGLPGVYILDQIHFHWESEHTLDGRRWPLEMHLVHHDRKYSSVKEAVRHNQGIAVLAVLFYEASSPNTELEPMLEAMAKVKSTPGTTAKITTKIAPQDLLPNQLNRFYRYSGSLTTPGCDEVVVWTVLTHPVPISPQQVEQFHQIQSQNGPIERNYRPIQKLNNRRIYVQYPPDGTHNLAYLTNRVASNCSASVIMLLLITLTSYVLNVKYFS